MYSSQFLRTISLKNVRKIGKFAFLSTNLKEIKNYLIERLENNEFKQNRDIIKVKLPNLKVFSPNAFMFCSIDTFDAKNVEEILEYFDIDQLRIRKYNFAVDPE